MFEAEGLEHYDEFFGACDRLLHPHGSGDYYERAALQ